jgi:hypothetical protein
MGVLCIILYIFDAVHMYYLREEAWWMDTRYSLCKHIDMDDMGD